MGTADHAFATIFLVFTSVEILSKLACATQATVIVSAVFERLLTSLNVYIIGPNVKHLSYVSCMSFAMYLSSNELRFLVKTKRHRT